MKIRRPLVIQIVAFLGAWLLRLWCATLRLRYRPLGRAVLPYRPGERFIFVSWHETLFFPACFYASRHAKALISDHADGELAAAVVRHCGYGVVRGSSTRGGAKAMLGMLRAATRKSFVILPDGPRGPRREVAPGLLFLAAKARLPIVLIGIGYDRPWRLRTWDRFCVPRPFSKVVVLTSEPIVVPEEMTAAEGRAFLATLGRQLSQLTDEASRIAEGRDAAEDLGACVPYREKCPQSRSADASRAA